MGEVGDAYGFVLGEGYVVEVEDILRPVVQAREAPRMAVGR